MHASHDIPCWRNLISKLTPYRISLAIKKTTTYSWYEKIFLNIRHNLIQQMANVFESRQQSDVADDGCHSMVLSTPSAFADKMELHKRHHENYKLNYDLLVWYNRNFLAQFGCFSVYLLMLFAFMLIIWIISFSPSLSFQFYLSKSKFY